MTKGTRWWSAAALALAMAAGGELYARYILGLGDPPLSVADSQIEYLFRPSASYRRFGNRVHYNAWSMRSRDFPPHKSLRSELRVLVIGDSVVNGGSETDQSQLATTLIEARLSSALRRPVTVGNISAGSWGPPNELAYIERFGFFDADAVILVLSSHDYADAPTFAPTVDVDPNYPGHSPTLALQEVFGRYLPRYLSSLLFGGRKKMVPPSPTQRDIDWSLASECRLIERSVAAHIPLLVAQHLERGELDNHRQPGFGAIADTARRCGAELLQLSPGYEAAISRGLAPYRDEIHPNALGQQIMADELEPWLEARLAHR